MDEYVDIGTSEQAKGLLDAEEVLGEKLVARVLHVRWDAENDDAFCWSMNECSTCFTALVEGAEGYVWGKPIGKSGAHVALKTYCGESCVDQAVMAWGEENEKPVVTGYFRC